MSSSGSTVQQADPQRGVGVIMADGGVRLVKVRVDVRVPDAKVLVLVGVDALPQQGVDAQRADRYQHRADQPFCAAGEPLRGGGVLEEPDEQGDQRDTPGVA